MIQAITNPGYLTRPIGQNAWENIFTGFTDPPGRGKTAGFSEFVAVDLGATNTQGLAKFTILYPKFPKTFCDPQNISIAFDLASVANGTPVTDAHAGISVVMIADAQGNPTSRLAFSGRNVFNQTTSGVYQYDLDAAKYQTGTYMVTIYGNAFPAYQGEFKVMH